MKKIITLPAVLLVLMLLGMLSLSGAASAEEILHNTPRNFLVFPKFDIRAGRSTQLRMVNSATFPMKVKLDYICPGIKHVNEFCSKHDRFITFTPFQTRIINVADHNPPCEQGFAVAVTVNERTNAPTESAWLYGSYHIADGRRLEANNAIALEWGEFPKGTNLFTDFQGTAPGDISGSRLVLLDLNILYGMQNPPGVVFIDFWNSAEEPFSTSHEFICWSEIQLDDIDANFRTENLGTVHGSMRIEPRPTCPIPGTCPPNLPHLPHVLGTIEQFGDGTRATRTLHTERYIDDDDD